MLKKIIKISACVVILLIVAYITYLAITFKNVYNPTPIKKEKITNSFFTNKEKFNNVSKFLFELDTSANVDLNEDSYVISVVRKGKVENINVNDKKVDEDLKYILFKLKYTGIISNENVIEYIRQSSSNWSRGLIYSKYGTKPYISNKSSIEEIDKNWYFIFDVAE